MCAKLFSKLDSFLKLSLANSTLGWKTNTIVAFFFLVAFSINAAIGTQKRHYSVRFPAQSRVCQT